MLASLVRPLRSSAASLFALAGLLLPLAAQSGRPTGRRTHRPFQVQSTLHHVPGDFASVQDAIDAAAPGDRIVVHGGTYDSITIDRPLTIVGDPTPLFVNGDASLGATALAPIRLQGSGAGRVVLCDVAVGGTVNGFLFSFQEGGIAGGGFDELSLFGCSVVAPAWVGLTGIAEGAPGIDVTLPALLVADSTVTGSLSTNDDCYGSGPPGPPGIRAPGATTILLDSSITGGGSREICGLGFCPGGGAGGAGIETQTVLRANSTVTGGTGALYYDSPIFTVPCGQAPDGPALIVAEEHVLPSGLTSPSGPPRAGGTWTLAWNPGASATLLVTRERELQPLSLALLGWYFLDSAPTTPWLWGLPEQPGTRSLYVPAGESSIGLTLTAQLLDLASGLSRPVCVCVRP